MCFSRRVDIPISEYGIIENTGGGFKGDKVVIFYEKQIGLYPRLEADQNPINGGIPQVHFGPNLFTFYLPDTCITK